MSRYIKIYKPFINAGMQEAVAYRVDWIFGVLGYVLTCFISYFIWNAVFISSGSNTLTEFTMSDMVLYIFLIFLTNVLIGSNGTYNVGMEIRDGSIAMRLIKPISYNSTFLFQELGNKIMLAGLIIVPIVLGVEIFRIFYMGENQFDILRLGMYFFSCIFAYLVNFFFNICFGFITFVFKYLWGANMMKECIVGFLSGSLIPLAFLPGTLEKVLLFLPFASLNYTPVMIYMRKYSGTEMLSYIGLQVFWCIALWMLSKFIWKISIRHLNIQGG